MLASSSVSLVLLVLLFVAIERARTKKAFSAAVYFCCQPAANVHIIISFCRQSAPGGCTLAVRALVTRRPKHLFCAESFLGGGLVED